MLDEANFIVVQQDKIITFSELFFFSLKLKSKNCTTPKTHEKQKIKHFLSGNTVRKQTGVCPECCVRQNYHQTLKYFQRKGYANLRKFCLNKKWKNPKKIEATFSDIILLLYR